MGESYKYKSYRAKILEWNAANDKRDEAILTEKIRKICLQRGYSEEQTAEIVSKGLANYNENAVELPTRSRYGSAHYGEYRVNNGFFKGLVRLKNVFEKRKAIKSVKALVNEQS